MQHLAGVRINRLQQPGGDAGLRVDPGAHAQDEALAARKVKVTLKVGFVCGHMDIDVAQLEVAQTQAAWIQVGIEFGDDAQLAHRPVAGVVKADAVRQRCVGRQVGIA